MGSERPKDCRSIPRGTRVIPQVQCNENTRSQYGVQVEATLRLVYCCAGVCFGAHSDARSRLPRETSSFPATASGSERDTIYNSKIPHYDARSCSGRGIASGQRAADVVWPLSS